MASFTLAALLGLSMAAIGFNIEHDGSHHSYSNHAWINLVGGHDDGLDRRQFLRMALETRSRTSYLRKHHRPDADIDIAFFGRLTPHQKRFKFHRWQHFYLWPLYGLNVVKWNLYDDFRDVILGRIGTTRMPRPKRWELVGFVGGKALFFTLAFGLPLLFHPLWIVLCSTF